MQINVKAFGLSVCVLILGLAPQIYATEYYVDQANTSASDTNPGTSALPWKSIAKANQILVAGDTVYIKAGTYSSTISPSRSGTATAPITYKNFGTATVTIQNLSYGILLDGKSYIVVQGLNFYNLDQFMYLQNGANHNTIAYCNFDQGRNIGWSGSKIYLSSSYNWIHHSRFSKYAAPGADDVGTLLDVGNEESQTDRSNYNLIEDSLFFSGGHHLLGMYGMYNVLRNNYFHNENWSVGYGDRDVYLSGYPANSGRNLIEGNQIAYSGKPPDNWGASGMSLTTGYNIVRLNRFYHNNLAGIAMTLTDTYYSDIVYNKIYNNTFFNNAVNMSQGADVLTSAIGMAVYSGSKIIANNAIKNNAYRYHYQVYGTYNASTSNQIFAGNWNGDVQGDPRFVNATNVLGNPADPAAPDLHLSTGSPLIDAGAFLTSVTSASGSGTAFQVADAGYFMDGWGIIQGDLIQLQGTAQRARITAVNYQTNTVTVDTSLTWTANQGIALMYQGTAPDIAAFETGGSAPTAPAAPTNVRIVR